MTETGRRAIRHSINDGQLRIRHSRRCNVPHGSSREMMDLRRRRRTLHHRPTTLNVLVDRRTRIYRRTRPQTRRHHKHVRVTTKALHHATTETEEHTCATKEGRLLLETRDRVQLGASEDRRNKMAAIGNASPRAMRDKATGPGTTRLVVVISEVRRRWSTATTATGIALGMAAVAMEAQAGKATGCRLGATIEIDRGAAVRTIAMAIGGSKDTIIVGQNEYGSS